MEEKNKENLSETQVISRLTDPTEQIPVVKSAEPEKDIEEEPYRRDDEKKSSASNEVLSFIRDLVLCMAVVLLVTNFVVRPVQVKGSSMYPTLEDTSFGFSNILGMNLGKIERFDVVIIYVPEKSEYLVKRVVALPGETVSYTDGQLFINGEQVDEPFLNQAYAAEYGDSFMDDVVPVTLGEDEYYCLGDNRPHSSDSRVYGAFKKANIKAKGIFVFWPFKDFGVETW